VKAGSFWPSESQAVRAGALALVAVGVAIRINNAFQYPINLGFDALENWRYIHQLIHSWALPAPDSDWATSHPPFFYYASAAVGRLAGFHTADPVALYIRLASSAIGLLSIGLAAALVHRAAPERPRRAWLAGILLLFLPVHIYMSAMLSEEILTSALISLVVVGTAWEMTRPREPGFTSRRALSRAAALGLVGGIAFMTKLSGCLVVMACALAVSLAGLRRRQLGPALGWAALLSSVALVVGGWYYAHNWLNYGYLYPQDLQVHEVMFTMPPGYRGIWDYVYVPLATWLDPQLLAPDLLHSVWGSSYVTIWFDGHRHYLARDSEMVTHAGTLILLLALLPSAAFATGMAGGIRRVIQRSDSPDGPLLWLVGVTLAGYVAFTYGNPWFASIKGSYLLGLSVPFAFYASEALDRWTSGDNRIRNLLVWGTLAALMLAVAVVFTYGPVYWNWAGRGIQWNPIEAP
jgi:hypothetical protein